MTRAKPHLVTCREADCDRQWISLSTKRLQRCELHRRLRHKQQQKSWWKRHPGYTGRRANININDLPPAGNVRFKMYWELE